MVCSPPNRGKRAFLLIRSHPGLPTAPKGKWSPPNQSTTAFASSVYRNPSTTSYINTSLGLPRHSRSARNHDRETRRFLSTRTRRSRRSPLSLRHHQTPSPSRGSSVYRVSAPSSRITNRRADTSQSASTKKATASSKVAVEALDLPSWQGVRRYEKKNARTADLAQPELPEAVEDFCKSKSC